MYAMIRKHDGARQLFNVVAHRHGELFDRNVWWPMGPPTTESRGQVPLDVYTEGDRYVVEADLPGMNQELLDLQMAGDTLSISGEYQAEASEGRQYEVQQRRSGTFQASITLADAVDASKITATYEQGVLRLSIPKSEAAKVTRIPLTAGK